MTNIWTPRGMYYIEDTRELEELTRVARQYDPNLSVGMNRQTGDICLFVKNEQAFNGLKPLYGWQRMPSADELVARLYRTDIRRHGDKILTDAWAEGEVTRKKEMEPIVEAANEAAERIEFEVRPR